MPYASHSLLLAYQLNFGQKTGAGMAMGMPLSFRGAPFIAWGRDDAITPRLHGAAILTATAPVDYLPRPRAAQFSRCSALAGAIHTTVPAFSHCRRNIDYDYMFVLDARTIFPRRPLGELRLSMPHSSHFIDAISR